MRAAVTQPATWDRQLLSVAAFRFQTLGLLTGWLSGTGSGRAALAAERATGRHLCRRTGQRRARSRCRLIQTSSSSHQLTLRSWLGRIPKMRFMALDIVN